jgi:Rrf2 family protein
MKISYKCDYALKAVLDLATHFNKKLVTAGDLAERIDAPIKFLEQILLELKKGGYVQSRRGNVGGYILSRSPQQITVGDIIRLIEGPIEPIACVDSSYQDCTDIKKCVFRKIWKQVHRSTSDIVDRIDFQQLADEVNAGQPVLAYHI